MTELSRVEAFVMVAQEGGFSAAAKCLGVTGPAVSKQIQSLENSLGVKLFHRTTRSVRLTEEGALYFERASRALADLKEAEQALLEMRECPTGRLRINAPMSFGTQYLSEPLADYAKQYPQVQLEVDFSDRWIDVVGEAYDLVIRIGALPDSSLKARKLADCPLYLCAAPSLVEQLGDPESADALAEWPAVVYHRHQSVETWQYELDPNSVPAMMAVSERRRHQGRIKFNSALRANTAEMQLQACLRGIGLAVLPAFCCVDGLNSGNLVRLLPHLQTAPVRGIYALYSASGQPSSRVRLMIDHLVRCAAEFNW